MICLYAADESLFEHNGLGILDNDLKKCHVEEVLNNLYTLTAQYPLWAKFGKSIRNGMIIKAPTPNGDQLFRIYQSKPSMGMLEIHAFHIFYDLAFNFVEDTNIVSKSGQAWLQQLSQNTQYSHPFTFFSDISAVAGSRVVRKNCVEILLNTSLDNSFVNRFGGEILRDNFNVYFNRAIGENRGFKIRHKKNLKGYTANIDDKSVITRIMPIGFDGLLLPEKYVDSPRISDYPFPRIGKVEVDVKAAVGENTDAKDAIPLNEAYTKMRALIKEQFGVIDVPTCSYEVDFVELSKTKEYADFQNLETVRIGDTVTVSHDEDGFYVEAKVIRYEYDSLAGRLLRIEAGQFESRSSNNSINQQRSIEQQLEDLKIETSNMVQVAANGKNTIYRGVDRPTNANVGDLWYEPLENSVVLKQWSGVDWELIPISDQNLGNVNVNNLSGNHIDVRRFRISSGDRDILYVNEAGEVILNAKRIQIDFTDVATKTDLQEIELTPGPQGAPGVGITSTVITYARSTSGTSTPTSGWTSSVPPVPAGEFLWTKTIWNYSDSTSETGYSVAKMGADGTSSYTHIAYADKSTDVLVDAISTLGTPSAYDGSVLTSTKIPGGYKITSTGGTDKLKQFVDFNSTTGKNCYTYVVIKNTHLINDLVVVFNGIGPTLNTDFPNVVVKPGQTYVDYRPAVCRDTYDFVQISIFATAIENDLAYEIYDYALFNTNPIINFSVGGNANNAYIGMYVDNVEANSTDPSKYNWTLIKGEDGRTPYIHFAYSDNADGTGLTSTDNGQRYIGHYSDYTQADSMDKTKYTWADRWAKIEVGWRNYFSRSLSNYNTDGLYAYRKLPKDTITISVSDNDVNQNIDGCFIGVTRNGYDASDGFYWIVGNGQLITDKITLNGYSFLSVYPKTQDTINKLFNRYKIKVETGIVATDWTEAPEDVQKQIDSKADQELTQQQLNMLIEKAQLMQTELQAKASMETLSGLERAYNAYVEANDKAVAKSEADLIEAGRRVDAMVETLGGLSKTKTFIDTYIKEAEEGIIIGTNDNVSQIRVTYDRIAMYSAGKEVMYISQGVIHINNGIFTKSLQVGRFRTEQHQTNLDINVCRYVG